MAEQTPISAQHASDLIAKGATVVDVRSAAGRATAGVLDGSISVAKDAIADFAESTDKDEEIVVFCGTTAGSGPVVDWLDENGFTNVVHVDGGFDALRDAGLPTSAGAPTEE